MASPTIPVPQIPTNPTSVSGRDFNLVRDADVLINAYLPPESASEMFIGGFKPQAVPHPDPERAQVGDLVELWPLPFCLPQLTSAPTSTFARGYNAELEKVELSQETVLKFVDGLNLAMTASPPLRIVDLTGMAIGFVYVSIPPLPRNKINSNEFQTISLGPNCGSCNPSRCSNCHSRSL
jgi:hypothetical protein